MKTIFCPTSALRVFILILFLLISLAPTRVRAQVGDSLVVSKEVDSLLTEASRLLSSKKLQEALQIAQQAAGISKEKWGVNCIKYATSLHRIASIYAELRLYVPAEENYLKAIELKLILLGKENLEYVASINNLANIYYNRSDYDKAEPLYLDVKDIREKILGKENQEYAGALNNLGNLYRLKADYLKAMSFLGEALEIQARVLGKEHPDYARSLSNLSLVYDDQGDYTKAESLLLEAIKIRKKTLGEEHPSYARSLNFLANLYREKGDFDKAEALFLKAINIQYNALGKDSPEYAGVIDNYATLCWRKGDYNKAEKLFLEAQEINTKILKNKGLDYPAVSEGLAILYREKGDYDKAEAMLLEAKAIQEKVVGNSHPSYARTLSNLGDVYWKKGNYERAESLYTEAKEIFANKFSKEHPAYASILGSLAVLFSEEREFDKAETLYLESINIKLKAFGKENTIYVNSLYNLGGMYLQKGDYDKAEPLLLDAEKSRISLLGKKHPDYTECLLSLANLYQAKNIITKSAPYFLQSNDSFRAIVENAAGYFTESQMIAYLNAIHNNLAVFESFAQTYPTPDFTRAAFNNALFYNGYLLENSRRLARSVAQADSLTRDTYERWQGCKRRLANEYAKPIAERKYVAEVETEAEGFEKSLTRNLANFGAVQKTPQWQDVRDRLHAGEAALEFIHFQYYTPKATDSTLYTALLLLPGDTCPHLIPLFEQRQLDQLLAQKRQDKRYEFHTNAPSLYSLVWQPLDALLQGVKTIYYAPSGALHSLNLDAIAVDANGDQTLIDRYNLVRLGSTRQLVIPVTASVSNHDALLFGGIRYEADSTAIQTENRSQGIVMRGSSDTAAPDSLRLIGALDPLPGTKTEAEFIRKLLQQKKFNTRLFTGFAASEEAFKQLADSISTSGQSARVIHLATHGYFFPDPKKQTKNSRFGDEPAFRSSEHPFLRSGLVLAGGNHAWQTGKPFNNGMEDGILTAYDISAMSLQNTELVVLSACETGLGDVAGNEGVFGLQRAFKIAGAQYLIMSLWNVPDAATKDLMSAFYNNWLNRKMEIPAAFRAAQLSMKARYNDPEMWAGFILIR